MCSINREGVSVSIGNIYKKINEDTLANIDCTVSAELDAGFYSVILP